jgi:hypothetical protein
MNLKFWFSHPLAFPAKMVINLDKSGFRFPDKFFLSCYYYLHIRERLNWDSPKKFCEKLNWIKLYDRNPLYTMMVDKCLAKKYVAEKYGNQVIIPTIAEYKNASEIEWERLPDRFVIKCNHDSASYVICKDKNHLNKEKVAAFLQKALDTDYYWISREWAYKDVSRRILVEEYIEDPSGDLKDYKFFCFNGEVKALFVASNRQSKEIKTQFDYFDADFNVLPMVSTGHPNSEIPPQKPAHFELMKKMAAEMSKGIPHVRIDFYETQGRVLFGEFTFYHDGGIAPLCPDKYETIFGNWIKLPERGK